MCTSAYLLAYQSKGRNTQLVSFFFPLIQTLVFQYISPCKIVQNYINQNPHEVETLLYMRGMCAHPFGTSMGERHAGFGNKSDTSITSKLRHNIQSFHILIVQDVTLHKVTEVHQTYNMMRQSIVNM